LQLLDVTVRYASSLPLGLLAPLRQARSEVLGPALKSKGVQPFLLLDVHRR